MTTKNETPSASVTVRSSEGTYDYLDRRLKEVEAKSVSFINNPLAGRLTLVYYIQGLHGPEKVEREFSGEPGRALRECNAKGEWKQVCEGLGSEGYTVSIGTNETLKGVVQREFKTFKRRDKTSGNPHLVSNMGRPKTVAGKNVNTYLDNASLAHAKATGGGNVSEGIRKALAHHQAGEERLAQQQRLFRSLRDLAKDLPPSPASEKLLELIGDELQELTAQMFGRATR